VKKFVHHSDSLILLLSMHRYSDCLVTVYEDVDNGENCCVHDFGVEEGGGGLVMLLSVERGSKLVKRVFSRRQSQEHLIFVLLLSMAALTYQSPERSLWMKDRSSY